VTFKMYFPSTIRGTSDLSERDFQDWFKTTNRRLEEWNKKARHGLAETIDLQLFRLNRPSTRFPNPSWDMRSKALKAAVALIKEYAEMGQSGKLFYIWYAAHYLTELGATLLDSIVTELEERTHGPSHLDDLEMAALGRSTRTFLVLIQTVATRWPDIRQLATTIEDIARPILKCIEQWSDHALSEPPPYGVWKQKLSVFLFPGPQDSGLLPCITIDASLEMPQAIAAQPEAHQDENITFSQPALTIMVPPLLATSSFDFALPLPSATEPVPEDYGASFDHRDMFGTTLGMDEWLIPSFDHQAIGNPDAMHWNFDGMDSEQIFAALLDGEDTSAYSI
jgi:hypothetical protein